MLKKYINLNQMSKFKITHLIIIILIIIIILQRSCSNQKNYDCPTETIKIDTEFIKIDSIVEKKVPIYVSIPGKIPSSLQPKENCDSLRVQYDTLIKNFIAINVYKDTLSLGKYGKLSVIDTIQFNELRHRTYIPDIQIPTITKTIIQKEESRRQLYIGINGFVNKNNITAFSPGLLYRNKKDQLYQASIGVDFNGTITYGIGTYWKIKMK